MPPSIDDDPAATGADAPYFFVLGVPKSGTTWVQKALDAHPELLCRGEGKFQVFRKELAKIASFYNYMLSNNHRKIFGEEFFPTISQEESERLYRSFMELRLRTGGTPDGVRRIGNKDPEHGTAIADVAAHFPDAAFIHVIRDPRDVAVSNWRHMNRLEPQVIQAIGDLQKFARQNVKEWTLYLNHVRRNAREKALNYVELRYEDLDADGPATLARIFAFLGVDAGAEATARCIDAASFERATGRKAGETEAESFYRKGGSGDWANHFDPDFADELLAMTGGLAGDLGYR